MTNEELAALLTKLDGEATPGPVNRHHVSEAHFNLLATYRNHHAQLVAGLAALGEVERLRGTLSYLRTQAKNGTIHPQVVIQNADIALGKQDA